MLSSHLYLGLPCDLLVRGFHLNIFLTVPVSGILCTWPNQLSLWALIQLTIFVCFINLSSSSLVLILHTWFSFVGPNILLKIFHSKNPQECLQQFCPWSSFWSFAVYRQGRIKLFGDPRQWKHFRPLFQAVFLSGGGGVLPPRQSNTTPPSPKTEITNILFYILNFASIIKFKM